MLLSFLLLGGAVADSGRAQSVEDFPPAPGTYISVGTHRLHLDCQGSGAPTVVLDSGLGGSSLDWALVQPEVAAFTRVCAYDRAGYAWSDPGPLPRNRMNIVRDLEQLLGYGSVAAPYLLVGHSLGGLIVEYYAHQNPQKIAGLVLIDATHEDQFRRIEEAASAPGKTRWALVVARDSYHVPEGLPDAVRLLAGAFLSRSQSIVTLRSELHYLRRSASPAAAVGTLPDVPLVVISHRVIPPATPTREDLWAEMWMEMQLDLVARTPQSKHVIASTDDHYVHIREPGLVIDAVRGIVEQYRHGEYRATTGADRR